MRDLKEFNKEFVMLSTNEKDVLLSYGPLTYPIMLISRGEEKQLTFYHEDTYFQPEEPFVEFVTDRRRNLAFNEFHHVRCKAIALADQEIKIGTEWSDFASFLGTNKRINEPFDQGGFLRSKLSVCSTETLAPSALANEMAAIGTFLIEQDHQLYLMLTKRSERLAVYPNCMSTSVSGAMGGMEKWTDFIVVNDKRVPDPKETIVRETEEEVGIHIDKASLKIDGLCLQVLDMQPIFLISAVLKETRESILQAMVRAKDGHEVDINKTMFVPFQLEEVIPKLVHFEWSPISAVAVFFLLEKYWSKEEIIEEIHRHIGR